MIQLILEGLRDGVLTLVFLLFNPFVACLLLLAFVVIAICLHGSKDRFGKAAVCLAVLLAGYTAFNVADYCVYRYCGALAVSPINQLMFHLFCSPDDLYEPYAKVDLKQDKNEYVLPFVHKYAGKHAITLVVANTNPKEFDYDHPDVIGLSFTGAIENGGEVPSVRFEKQYTTYFLIDGENNLSLFDYEVGSRSELKATNRVSVTITGDLVSFLSRYPGSYLCVKNATTK